MKTKTIFFCGVLLLAFSFCEKVISAEQNDGGKLKSAFFALCMDTNDEKQRSIDEQNKMLAELGYDGVAHLGLVGLSERVKSAKKQGLKVSQVYLNVDLSQEPPFDSELAVAISCLKGEETQLALLVYGAPPSDETVDDKAIAVIQKILDVAEPLGVQVVLYPHLGAWNEKVSDCLRIAKRIPDKKVGVMFNLCHWIAVDRMENLETVLRAARPYLMAVTVNGTDTPEEVQTKSGNWLQPLDRGTFDLSILLSILDKLDYRGPVGLQCYGIPGDTQIHLERSINKWREISDTYFIETDPSKVDMDKRTRELQNLQWGAFVCWSFSTFSGKEWTPEPHGSDFFNATGCDTDQWCKTMQEAEMGYVLFLTKHHDGFCLWDTATTELKVTNSPLKRDVLADLKQSCDKYGIKLALYFSEGDWAWEGSNPGSKGGPNPEMKKAQLKELLTQYGPIEYIWFDHAIGDGGLNHEETVNFCKELQPGCFIGFNHGPAAGDIRLGEMGRPGPLEDTGAAGFNSGHMVGYNGYRLAEFTYPILPPHEGGAIWFYSLTRHDKLVHSVNKLYKDYLGAVKFGNIFALDVGPNYEGKFRDVDIQTLREVGQMIRDKVALPVPLSTGKMIASSVWKDDTTYGPQAANDGEQGTRWGAMENSRAGWLQIDFESPVVVDYAIVDEAIQRTESFKLSYLEDGSWETIIEGGKLGPEKRLVFPQPVRASSFRLNILSASEVPTINEFQLYKSERVGKVTYCY